MSANNVVPCTSCRHPLTFMCSSAPENWSFLFCFLQFIFFVLLCVCCCFFLPRGAVVYIIVPNKMGNLD